MTGEYSVLENCLVLNSDSIFFLQELEKLDPDEIMAKHVEQLEVEKKELQMRLKAQEKKVDFFARAKRVEEIPLLIKQYEEQSVSDKKLWEEMEEQRVGEGFILWRVTA